MNRLNRQETRRQRPAALLVLAAAFLLLGGCAASGSSLPEGVERGPSDRIIQEEIDYWRSQGALDVYELVSRARPRWLRTTLGGTSVGGGSVQNATTVTYRNGNHLGGVEELQNERLDGIAYVEWLSASEADILPGARDIHISGAIRIVTTQPSGGI